MRLDVVRHEAPRRGLSVSNACADDACADPGPDESADLGPDDAAVPRAVRHPDDSADLGPDDAAVPRAVRHPDDNADVPPVEHTHGRTIVGPDGRAYALAEPRADASSKRDILPVFSTVERAFARADLRADVEPVFSTVERAFARADLRADVEQRTDRALQRLLGHWVQQREFERPLRVRRDDERRATDLRLGQQHALPLLRRELRRRRRRALE